jgi:hypothetical protein
MKSQTVIIILGDLDIPTSKKTEFFFTPTEAGDYRLFIKNIPTTSTHLIPQAIVEACSKKIDIACSKKIFDTNLPKTVDRAKLLVEQCDPNPYNVYCREVLLNGEMNWTIHTDLGVLIDSGDYTTRGYYSKNGVPLNTSFKLESKKTIKITFYPSTKQHPEAYLKKVKVLFEVKK